MKKNTIFFYFKSGQYFAQLSFNSFELIFWILSTQLLNFLKSLRHDINKSRKFFVCKKSMIGSGKNNLTCLSSYEKAWILIIENVMTIAKYNICVYHFR